MNLWKIEAKIKSYFVFNKKCVYKDIEFFSKDNMNYATLLIEALSMNKAEESAILKLNNALNSMGFYLNSKLSFSIKDIKQQRQSDEILLCCKSSFHCNVTVVKPFDTKRVEEIEEIHDLLTSANDNVKKAFKAYNRGLELEEWNIESFLNYFKAIEIISNSYFVESKAIKELHTQEHMKDLLERMKNEYLKEEYNTKQILDLVNDVYKLGFIELKLKIKTSLEKLELQHHIDKIDKIVNLRNKVAAHASSKMVIKESDILICREIAKEMVLRTLKVRK